MMDDDLLEIITDPDLGGCSFVYERITESVGPDGRPFFSVERNQAGGNIQPAPGREREILDEEDRLKASLLVFTPAPLTAGAGNVKADRVFYGGMAFRVALAEPWREHGGFTKALAVLETEATDE